MKTLSQARTYWRFSYGLAALIALCATASGADQDALQLVARDPAGHGLLCRCGEKTILMVSGTPKQMGAAHGTLLREPVRKMRQCVLASLRKDAQLDAAAVLKLAAEIERHGGPHMPPRFFAECDAMSKAVGFSRADGRCLNLFTEQFHCSGVAVRGTATIGGKVLHARVLDYTTDGDFQKSACIVVFMPEGHNAWMSLGYAGLLGTVTAMNEKGLAIGEKGNGGEGLEHWNGMPMTFLLRDIMERASTVREALDIFRTTPRTCDYSYVVSDKSGDMRAMHCTPEKMIALEPGQQHPEWTHVPADTVFISMHPEAISKRLQEEHGKIDVPRLMDIIKRPVASDSNLHDAIFAPQTLEMWFADAGNNTCACDEPYTHVNLKRLIGYYRATLKP